MRSFSMRLPPLPRKHRRMVSPVTVTFALSSVAAPCSSDRNVSTSSMKVPGTKLGDREMTKGSLLVTVAPGSMLEYFDSPCCTVTPGVLVERVAWISWMRAAFSGLVT